MDALVLFWNLRRKACKLIRGNNTYFVSWDIKQFLRLTVIDCIPDALFIAIHNKARNPMCRRKINPVSLVCKNTTGAPCITKWNRDLTQYAHVRNLKHGLLVKCFDRLDRSRVGISAATDFVPCGIEWVAVTIIALRSEEHTSELQSRRDLV